ncbi:MAG: Dihydrolipoyl dehydrogenase [Methanoregula sp. PtaU1.Bin051]|nr:MAG: Dihydrolipoyl dehydrogenase [Methanoregula sp. PtaU1.Bin051]
MILVLGGGPAGRIGAIRLAAAGKDVTLVEAGGIGGQCLHYGCMPVCALNDAARFVRSAERFKDLGIIDSTPSVVFPRLLKEMQAIQQKIARILDSETKEAGVTIVYGKHGRLSGRQVFIGDEPVDSDAVLVTTGSRPNVPKVEGIGLHGVFSPHTLWSARKLPESIVIIGGGVMAAEFAYIFRAFGNEVTLVARSTFLKGIDRHLRSLAVKQLDGVAILENTPILSIEGCSEVTGVRIGTGGAESTIPADAVLIATGLVPRSEAIEGVMKGQIGEVIVNDRMQTSVPGVYAAGDVTGPPYLTPVARMQGAVAADNILGIDRKFDRRFIPQSISLGHELAFCGNGSETAGSIAIPGPAGPGTFWDVPFGDTGLAKVSVEDGGAIAGICAAGPGGGLIAGYLSFLMKEGYTAHDFEEFLEVHPSTDGVYGLLKYASALLKKRENV